ncbi:MAG: hypothetical protein ACRDRH_00095 [Pseudonocardia sp.]
MPAEFWQTEQFQGAFAAQHIGRVARAYRVHPHHHAAYGPSGISQTLLGHWLGLRQPQVSQIETGPPIRDLDILVFWVRTLGIPAGLLWFDLPGAKRRLAVTEPAARQLAVSAANGVLELSAGPQSNGVQPGLDTSDEPIHDPEHDPVLAAPWSPRGTIDAAVMLRGGGSRVERRSFVFLTGALLTAPAHQWLVHDPGPLVSGLSGRRVSTRLVDRLTAMIAELRRMDDVAGGGSMLTMAQHQFGWVAGLLDRASYDERTSRALHVVLAELGQLCGWGAYDAGQHGLAQRYNIAALRAAHSADDRALGAHILGWMAKQAAHQGRPAEAATFAESALVGVRGYGTPRLLAELHIRRAYASATLHDRSACDEAISKACIQIEQFDSAGDPPWLYWVTPAWVTVEAGACLRRSEQTDRAAAMLTEGITLFDESFARDRQLYTIHLIDTLVCPGKQQDLDAAASRGLTVLQQAENLDSTLSADLLRDLYHQMKPHGEVLAVREFLERAKGLVEERV